MYLPSEAAQSAHRPHRPESVARGHKAWKRLAIKADARQFLGEYRP